MTSSGEDAAPAVRARDVVRRYRGGQCIGPVSVTIPAGTCFGLVGANGAGKTTLLRMLLGLDRPSAGEIELFGRPVLPDSPPHRTSGMIEEPRFFGWLDARENLRSVFAGRDELLEQIDSVLELVGLGHARSKPVRAYSQGMRQRLGLARVLGAQPDLLVLDEPTNGLDPKGIRWLRNLLLELVADGRTVLLSSHLLHEVQAVSGAFLMMEQGQVVANGEVADIRSVSSLEELYFSAISG